MIDTIDVLNEELEELAHMNHYFFWDYIYKAKHVQCYSSDKLNNLLESIKVFDKYEEDEAFFGEYVNRDNTRDFRTFFNEKDYFIVRNFLNAFRSEKRSIETTFPVNKLNSNEVNILQELEDFCRKNTYFPWDIFDCPTSEIILEKYHEKQMLIAPYILSLDKLSKYQSTLCKLLSGVDHVTSEKFNQDFLAILKSKQLHLEEIAKCNKEMPEKEKQEMKIIKENLLLEEKFLSQTEISNKKKNTFSEKLKATLKPKYANERSFWVRLLGFMLWEEKNKYPAKSIPSLIALLLEKKLLENLFTTKKHISRNLFETRNAERWLVAATKSIEEGRYIPI